MVREQLAPPSEKTVGHASGKKSGDERPFANAINRPEKEETHADGNRRRMCEWFRTSLRIDA